MEQTKLLARYLMSIFRNDTNGYTVAHFITYDDQEDDLTVTGIFGELHEDEIYTLYGHYEEHPKYGMQFQAERYTHWMPNDMQTLIRYFSSAKFPGIGRKIAQAIVEMLGEDTIRCIKEDPNVLDQISALPKKKKQIILDGVMHSDDLDDTIVFFTTHGLSNSMISKIQAAYGEEAVRIVKENPYRMVADIDGIGFATADKLAKHMEFDDDHPYRIKAAVLSAVLNASMSSGDTYVSSERIQRELMRFFAKHIENLDEILEELCQERLIVMEENRIYHHTQYDAECGIAAFLARYPYEELDTYEIELDEEIKRMEQAFHIEYESKQKEAIKTFYHAPFSIISGGPGTGKTTIVKGILHLIKVCYPHASVSLCAPTGRAAKRMSQLSNTNATTIHALLKWDLDTNSFVKDVNDPLDMDILIVDEFSMVDAWVFYHLLRASKPVSKIVLIGDENQLPSVGPGCVLKDLMDCACFPIIRLEKIFRQCEGSDVIDLAHHIKDGKITDMKNASDVAFFPCQSHDVVRYVIQIVENAYEKGYDNQDIQVLAPMYHGSAGIDVLNHALQKIMNPPATHKRELPFKQRIFREGDKILQLKNQPDDQVYNGDIGEIVEIIYAHEHVSKQNTVIARFDEEIVEYFGEQLTHITHAYCISIHKAQGSEYPIVIMPMVNEYRHMLQRRLFYTGVTRAKKSLVLLGQMEAIQRALQTLDHQMRKSTLKQRIIYSIL